MDFISCTVSPLATFLSLRSLVINNQGWSYTFSPFMGHIFHTRTFFPWGATDRGLSQKEVSTGPKRKGTVPCRLPSQWSASIPQLPLWADPAPFLLRVPSGRPPLWKSLHFSLWTSHPLCSEVTGRRNCCWEAEQVLSPPCSGLGGWSPGKESNGNGPEASRYPERIRVEGLNLPSPFTF